MIKNENHGEIAIVTFSDEFHAPNRRNDSFSTPQSRHLPRSPVRVRRKRGLV